MAFKLNAVLTVALGVALLTPAYGQTSKGILAGTARDTTGAVLPNAVVTIKSESTGQTRTLKTSSDGSYRFDAIDPGPYTIDVTSPGFMTFEAKSVQVLSTVTTSYDVNVTVGRSSDVVSVEADQSTINTENGQLAGAINAVEINKLPIFSLNPIELATTVPGVQQVSQGAFSNGINIQVNGARPRSNNYLLDGQEINDIGIGGQAFQPQIPDTFQSVNVITNSASAEFGRAGGGIVNLVTKSGTNQYHGTLFERYFGSGLNSIPGGFRGPTSVTNYKKPRVNTHSFGFTGGGRILKDKLFVFGALELQRTYGKQQAGVNLLPDAAGYATLQTITGAPAAQVQLLDQYLSNGAYLATNTRYTPVTTNAQGQTVPTTYTRNVGALPGCPTTGCIISFAGFQRPNADISSPDTQWMYRVDYHPWEKDSISFRYLHDRSSFSPDFSNNGNALAGFDSLQGGPSELGEGQWTHVFTTHLLNEFRVSEARIDFQFAPTPQTLANPLNTLATINLAGITTTTSAGTTGIASLGPNQNFPQGRKEDLYQFQDTISYTRGRHSMRFGADIGRLIEIDLVSQNAKGTLNFANGGSGTTSLGNFLLNQLGPSGSATKTFGQTRVDAHGYRNGVFAQDDIKLTTDLTVNLGVRYDYLNNPINSLPFPGIDVNNIFAPINAYVKVNNDYNNISPRIGFAYAPRTGMGFITDGKTVIRGGFGIFYDSTFSNILVNSAQSSPNAVSGLLQQTTGNGLANATSLISTITPNLTATSAVTSEANNLVNPVTYQYNLGVERELPGQIALSVRYVGNTGHKLFANQQFNYFNGLTGARLNPARGAINLRGNYADSNYNGLEISANHNFRHGLDVRANYVFSKDLDNGSEIFTIGGSSPTSYSADLSPGGRRQDYSNSAYDHRQYFSVAYVYTPKGLHSENRFADAAFGILTRHWTVSGVTQLQSGAYSTLNANGFDLNGDGSTANDRPIEINRSASPHLVGVDGFFLRNYCGAGVGNAPTLTGTYYNISECFNNGNNVPVAVNSVRYLVPYFPNNSFLKREVGRNTVLLPGSTTNNIALEKGIGLSYLHFERGALLLRAEAQNIGNHNDNGIGDLDVLDADEGFLTKARQASNRTLILWAKLQF